MLLWCDPFTDVQWLLYLQDHCCHVDASRWNPFTDILLQRHRNREVGGACAPPPQVFINCYIKCSLLYTDILFKLSLQLQECGSRWSGKPPLWLSFLGHTKLILCFTDCLGQKHDPVGRQKNKNDQILMNLIRYPSTTQNCSLSSLPRGEYLALFPSLRAFIASSMK